MKLFLRFRLYKDMSFQSYQNTMLAVMVNFGFNITCFVQRQTELLENITSDTEKIERFTDALSDIINKANGNIHNDKVSTVNLVINDMTTYYFVSGFVSAIED